MYKIQTITFVLCLLSTTTFGSNNFVTVEIENNEKAPFVSAFNVQLTSLSNHASDDRAKRITRKDIGYRLSFEGVGIEFDYFVKLNRKLAIFDLNSTFSLWDGDQLISRRTHESYPIFDNTVEYDEVLPDELAQIVVTPTGQLVNAIVQKDGETYTLERLEHVQPSLEDLEHKRFASESEWVMHKHSDIKGFSKGFRECGSDNSDAEQPLGKRAINPQKRRSQFPLRWHDCFSHNPTLTRTISIGIAVDVGFYRRLNSDINLVNNQIISVFAHSNYIYYYQVGIVLTAGEVIVQTNNGGPSWNRERQDGHLRCPIPASFHLDQFSAWVNSNRSNPTSPEGLWHLFTDCFPAHGVVGIAWLGVLCRSPFNNGAPAGLSSFSANWWITVAHEIGHNFGANHPFEMGAERGRAGGIMDYSDGMFDGIFQFNSEFAKDDVCEELRRASGLINSCIRIHTSTCGNGIVEYGEGCDDTSACCIQPGNQGECTLAPDAECSNNECCESCKIRPTWFTCEIPGLGPNSGHCGWGKCAIPGITKISNAVFCPIQQEDPCVYNYKTSPTGNCLSGRPQWMFVARGAACSATNPFMKCNGTGTCAELVGDPPFGDNLVRANDKSDQGTAIGIGVAVGTLLLLGLAGFVFFLVKRRRNQAITSPSVGSNLGPAQPNTSNTYNASANMNVESPPYPNNPPSNNFSIPMQPEHPSS